MSQNPQAKWHIHPRLVLLLGTFTLMGPMAIDIFLPAIPAMGAFFQATPAESQAIIGVFLLGLAIGQPIYGPLSDRLGRRPPLLFGALLYFIASVACIYAASIEQLLIARFIQALGASAGAVVTRAVVRDMFDFRESARMLSLMMLIVSVAPLVAPAVGSAILILGDWHNIFWLVAILGGYVFFSTMHKLPETRSEATARRALNEHPLRTYWSLLKLKPFLGYAIAGSANGAALFAYLSSAPDLIMNTYGLSLEIFPIIFAVNAIGILLGHHFNRQLLKTLQPDEVLKYSSLIIFGLTLLLALAATTGIGGHWTVLPLIFLVLSSYGFVGGNTIAGALNVDPTAAGASSALMGSAAYGTGAISATFVGLFHDGTAVPLSLIMLAGVSLSTIAIRMIALPNKNAAHPV